MKKIYFMILILLISGMLIGCGDKSAALQKTEEELKAEIRAEIEAEAKKEKELEAKIRMQLQAEQNKDEESAQMQPNDIKLEEKQEEFQEVKNNEEQKGNEEAAQLESQVEKKEQASDEKNDILLEKEREDNVITYLKYKSNKTVSYDLDGDGINEEIKYDTDNGKLDVAGYDSIDINTIFAEKDYFIIVRFIDKYDTDMNMVGIIDYGPSTDPTTSLYSIISPMGEKWFGSVGKVPGELVTSSEYDNENMNDFNYKAVLRKDKGIEAPVRLSILPQTWFGRNLFTYYSTYKSLIDNNNKYNQDYVTRSTLNAEEDIIAYSEKDLNSDMVTIKSGRKVYVIATDNKEWIAVFTEDSVGGWVNIKDISTDSFSGYTMFD